MRCCEHHLFFGLDPRNNGEACCADTGTRAAHDAQRLLLPPDVRR